LPPEFTRDLLTGVGAYLAEAGVCAYQPDIPYTSGQVGYVIGDPVQFPDRQIAARVYSHLPTFDRLTDVSVRVQFRLRGSPGDPLGADAIADSVYAALDGAGPLLLPGGLWLTQASQVVVAALGQDDNARWQRADSYQLLTTHSTPHRED
jgi:Bacteriophage minor capsid protein